MATKRIKDLTNTAASVASDAYLAIDGTSNGTEKITRDNFRQDTADAFVAAPGTYNLAPLSGGAVEVAKGGTGSTTAAGARTNLSVNSKDEDAQAYALKTTAPALYFNGSSSVVEVAYDGKLSFTDNVNDLPFTISAFVKTSKIGSTELPVLAKWNTSSREEYRFGFSSAGDLELWLRDESASESTYAQSTSVQTAYNGQWVHIAATYAGTSGGVFSSAADGITLYINGVSVEVTANNNANYLGLESTIAPLVIGKRSTSIYFDGSIRDCKIFNRELTATEVAELARGNDLGFSDEWGGATATSGTLTVGKRYRLRDWITGDDFTNVGAGSNADGVEFVATGTTPTTWTNSSVVESIGTLADFRAENFDSATGKIYDLSSNGFVGTSANLPTLTGRAYPVYESAGTFTPTVTFGGGSTGLTYSSQEGFYTRIGDLCYFRMRLQLSAKGSSTGSVTVEGLPFTSSSAGVNNQVVPVYILTAASLTGQPIALIDDGGTGMSLVDISAAGQTSLTEGNFTDTTTLRISGTYQIQ